MRNPETESNPAPVMAGLRFPVWLIAALLALVTIGLYWPATRCDFINYDDPFFVAENPHVRSGFTWEGVKWAFSNTEQAAFWAPMMWLSHLLAFQLFGLNPWGHHLINVLLHAANTVLVFLLLWQMTALRPDKGVAAAAPQAGALWRSVLVAALFGLHPLHVESVAWVAERKDVLSTFFGLLSLLFYVRYAQNKEKLNPRHSAINYPLALLFFAFGLMSKTMLVTWPFVMLLLDYWPLGRVTSDVWRVTRLRIPVPQLSSLNHLLLEKVPFFGLAAVMSVVTYVVQKQTGILAPVETLPLGARCGNALISYCRYLEMLFWPTNLAIVYPHPGYWPMEQVVLAGGVLLGITVFFILKRRRYPFLLTGWLWFCGTLVPVIQLVQTGSHAMADRYTYIPSLGVFILAVWGAYELTRRWRYQVMVLSVAGCAVIVLCLRLTRQQLGYWQDSETIFRHAIAVTENNYIAHHSLGFTLGKNGRTDEAIGEFQEAIRLKPDFAKAHDNLGTTLLGKGQINEAINEFQEAIHLAPDDADAHNNLGNALLKENQIDEAIDQYQEAIRLKPDLIEAHYDLGNALGKKGQTAGAISQYQEAIRLKPDYAEAHNNLGTALGMEGQTAAAISQYQEAIRLKPDFAEARNNLGTALGMKGQTAAAISQYQEAIRLKPDFAEAHDNLAKLFAAGGQLNEAVSHYRTVIQLKPDSADAHGNLANVLAAQGRLAEAIPEYRRTLELAPDSAQAHFRFGQVLQAQHHFAAAKSEYQKALELNPQNSPVYNNLAWLLATCPDSSLRDGEKAVALAQEAEQLDGLESPQLLDTLAAAYAEAGRFGEAVETARQALNLLATQKNKPLAEAIQSRLKCYEANSPYHEKP
jgi:protein O-mannosyl-transferase